MTSEYSIHTIAFYNTENLFDVFVDEKTNDRDFLPLSPKNWTKQRYERKISKLGSVICKIGHDSNSKPPVLIGLAEVENAKVLQDLIDSEDLKNHNYGFVHFDSLDERGIDVALLFNRDDFRVENSMAHPISFEEESGKTDFTRDILLVTGYLNEKKIHVLINHWPSRNEGRDETNYKRVIAAAKLTEIISSLRHLNDDPQIFVLGDFNDNPTSTSIMNLKEDNGLFNPMESIWSYSRGSVNHNFTWILFDQILMSSNIMEEGFGPFTFLQADIFDKKFLTQNDGKYKGQPYRTYVGKKYKGGFSDHFPVFVQIAEK